MVDIDACHPERGEISPDATPDIARRFAEMAEALWAQGIGFPGDASMAWIDCSPAAIALAEQMGLEGPRGYWSHAELRQRLAGVQWQGVPHGQLLERFISLCLEEGLDVYFT